MKKEWSSFIGGLNVGPEIIVDPTRLRLHVIREMKKNEKRMGVEDGQLVKPTEEENKSLATLPNESSSSSSSPNTSSDGNNSRDMNTDEPIADESEPCTNAMNMDKEEENMSETCNDAAYMKME